MRTENLNYLAAAFNKGSARQAPPSLQARLHSLTVDNRSGFSISQRDGKKTQAEPPQSARKNPVFKSSLSQSACLLLEWPQRSLALR